MSLETFTFVLMLNAFASLDTLEEGMHAYEQIIKSSLLFCGSGLADIMSHVGAWRALGDCSTKRCCHAICCWIATILGHVKCGQGQKLFKLFSANATGRHANKSCH
jgi:hypothetical protein